MLSLKEIKAKKIPYAELDDDTKEYVYDIFKRYVVRKQIADKNKELSSIFSRLMLRGVKTSLPSDYSANFNQFNSAFIGTNLIDYLDYSEIQTDLLRNMSETSFNMHLNEIGNSFYRKMALICFSGRPSERIANRVEFPVMVAYANMQTLVLNLINLNPQTPLYQIFDYAAEKVHDEFYKKNGYQLSESDILKERVDYKSIGKKAAPVWKDMMEFYKKGIRDFRVLEAASFIRENFVFTNVNIERYDHYLDQAMKRAGLKLSDDLSKVQERVMNEPEVYTQQEYEQFFTREYADDVYFNVMERSIMSIFDKYLKDPIYEEKEPKKKESN